MAKITLGNGETGLTIRNAINTMFTELYKLIVGGTAGGQTIIGGSLTNQDLNLRSNGTDLTTGSVNVLDTLEAASVNVAAFTVAGGVAVKKKLIATDITAINTISGNISGSAGTVTGATLTTALTVDTGTVTLKGAAANSSVVTLGAGAIGLAGSNTGDECTLSGVPFFMVKTLTAASAATPVAILTDVQVGAGKKVYIDNVLLNVAGGTAWTDATATIVTIQDTAAVVGATYAKAQLTGNAIICLIQAGITLAAPVLTGVGFTTAKGISIVGNGNFAAGSNIIVTVTGFIK